MVSYIEVPDLSGARRDTPRLRNPLPHTDQTQTRPRSYPAPEGPPQQPGGSKGVSNWRANSVPSLVVRSVPEVWFSR